MWCTNIMSERGYCPPEWSHGMRNSIRRGHRLCEFVRIHDLGQAFLGRDSIALVPQKKTRYVSYICIGHYLSVYLFCFVLVLQRSGGSCYLSSLSTVYLWSELNTHRSLCPTFRLFPGLTQFLVNLPSLLVCWTFPLCLHLHNHYLPCIM